MVLAALALYATIQCWLVGWATYPASTIVVEWREETRATPYGVCECKVLKYCWGDDWYKAPRWLRKPGVYTLGVRECTYGYWPRYMLPELIRDKIPCPSG